MKKYLAFQSLPKRSIKVCWPPRIKRNLSYAVPQNEQIRYSIPMKSHIYVYIIYIYTYNILFKKKHPLNHHFDELTLQAFPRWINTAPAPPWRLGRSCCTTSRHPKWSRCCKGCCAQQRRSSTWRRRKTAKGIVIHGKSGIYMELASRNRGLEWIDTDYQMI